MSETKSGPTPTTTIHYRPSQPGSLVGDVIPFYHDGTYHVFYLRAGLGPMPWAHIGSRDLVNWEEYPDALTPGSDPLGVDAEGCWTGSVVATNNGFRIYYTGKNMQDPQGDQKVCVAESQDLVHWTKLPELTFYADGQIYWSKPVNGPIDDKQTYHHQAFRDAEVLWNPHKQEWWMLLHAVLADGSLPCFALYTSQDLDWWIPQQPLYTCPQVTMSGDCPHFFEMNGTWYIVQAEHHFILSKQPEGPYSEEVRSFDHGLMVVPKSMWGGKRRIVLGWLRDNEGFHDSGNETWGGTMSMARELYSLPNGELRQRPVREVVDFFNQPLLEKGAIKPATETDWKQVGNVWQGVVGKPMKLAVPGDGMMQCRVTLEKDSVLEIGLRTQADQSGGGYCFRLKASEGWGELASAHKAYRQDCGIKPDQKVDIQAFLMGDIIEVFVNEAWCYSIRAYDHREGFLSIRLQGGSGDIEDLSFRVRKED